MYIPRSFFQRKYYFMPKSGAFQTALATGSSQVSGLSSQIGSRLTASRAIVLCKYTLTSSSLVPPLSIYLGSSTSFTRCSDRPDLMASSLGIGIVCVR